MNNELQKVLKNLPKKPGVYRYYGSNDSLLYVGKAKNLKNRVSSYFQTGRPHNQRISLMISQIAKIEFTVVESEEESLLLEANLINSLQPKYNVALKNNKNYYYIRLTKKEIPGLFVVRQKYDPESVYFGPYVGRYLVEETLRTIRNIFPFCQEGRTQGKPCGYVGIGLCDGVCAGYEDKSDYLAKIEQIKLVLSGRLAGAEQFLRYKIEQAAEDENFALASLWKSRLLLLQKTIASKKVILPIAQDLDLISLVLEEDRSGLKFASVFVQQIREGRLINVHNLLLSGSENGLEEEQAQEDLVQKTLARFLESYYAYQAESIPVLVQSFSAE